MAEPNSNTRTTICPVCQEEGFVVAITDSGSWSDATGAGHWFEGDGECECGYKGWFSDST